METKDKVRQRRTDRIREIQQSRTAHGMQPSPYREKPSSRHESGLPRSYEVEEHNVHYRDMTPQVGPPRSYETDERRLYRRDEAAQGDWNDPEFVWNQKYKREWGAAASWNELEEEWEEPSGTLLIRNFARKMLISAILFGLVWGIFQVNHPLADEAKRFIRTSLTESKPFDKLAVWYDKTFQGAPSFIPVFGDKQPDARKVSTSLNKSFFVPVQGKIAAPFDASHLGIIVETKADATVSALATGLVIYAGQREDTGFTVIVQHADKLQSVYGWIDKSYVQQSDWIKGGEAIGKVAQDKRKDVGTLYFAVMKDKEFINPLDVVRFD